MVTQQVSGFLYLFGQSPSVDDNKKDHSCGVVPKNRCNKYNHNIDKCYDCFSVLCFSHQNVIQEVILGKIGRCFCKVRVGN